MYETTTINSFNFYKKILQRTFIAYEHLEANAKKTDKTEKRQRRIQFFHF